MQYLAFKYLVGEKYPTFGLVPLDITCSMQTGYYNGNSDELVLISKDRTQEMKMVEKLDDFGEVITKIKKGKMLPVYDRRTFDTNLNFRLTGKEMNYFIEKFVINFEVCTEVFLEIQKLKDEALNEQPTEKGEQ